MSVLLKYLAQPSTYQQELSKHSFKGGISLEIPNCNNNELFH